MRYYLDEHNEVWSEKALEDEYNRLKENRMLSEDTESFGDYLYDCIHNACTLTNVVLSEYDEKHLEYKDPNDRNIGIDILMVDAIELPYVLNALLKQDLYRITSDYSNKNLTFEERQYEVRADINKINHVKQILIPMLESLKTLYDSKIHMDSAQNRYKNIDEEVEIDYNCESIMDTISMTQVNILKLIKIIIPNLKTTYLVDEWFYEESDGYIDALIKWCELPIKIEHLED